MKTDYKRIELYAKRYKSAKGYEYQTIFEHSINLIDNLKRLFGEYSERLNEGLKKMELDYDRLKFLLWLASLYHDLGKANSRFQSKIRDKNKLREVCYDKSFFKEIPHNFVSLVFIDLNSEKKIWNLTFEEEKVLLYSIAFSHDRDFNFDKEYFKRYIQQDVVRYVENATLKKCFEALQQIVDVEMIKNRAEFVWKIIDQFRRENLREEIDLTNSEIRLKVILKGFLHRLDYASSANVIVEEAKINNFPKKVEMYLKSKGNFNGFREFQQRAIDFSDENIILFAPTGSGKTEFALNWAKESKLIYTLPIRVSINAMYERFVEIFEEDKVGILHSDSAIYLFGKNNYQEEEIEALFYNIQLAKSMSLPVIVTTGDQIFNAAFKWPGFEKVYSLFLYSKLVVDEPQSYSPGSLAIIIRTLEEIVNINGRFCLMSATINPLINKHLSKFSIYMQAYTDDELEKMKSHIIDLNEVSIIDVIDIIIDEATKGKKVLVICNTVRRAQDVYFGIKKQAEKCCANVQIELLHSRFLESQRRIKEHNVMNDKSKSGIFISTQIVEASLDIDFDILFTELCSADSLLQRMGRIFRKRKYDGKKPNVIILTQNTSGLGRVYERVIAERTLDYLKKFDKKPLSELDKKKMNEYVYDIDALSETTFMKDFKNAYDILKVGYRANTKAEAQKLFRDVMTINAIPRCILEKHADEIESALDRLNLKNLSASEKLKLISIIQGFSVNIPAYYLSKAGGNVLDKNRGIFIVDCSYDDEIGAYISNDDEDFII